MDGPEMMVLHSKFPPSSFPHWKKCTGFLSGVFSSDADRGNSTDSCLSALISGLYPDVPAELQDQVEYGLKVFQEALDLFLPNPTVFVQRRVYTDLPSVWGTLDWAIVGKRKFDPEGGVFHDTAVVVGDWKTGYTDRGFDMIQMALYFCGLKREFPEIVEVDLWRVELDKEFTEKTGFHVADNLVEETYREAVEIIEKVKKSTERSWTANSSCKYCLRAVTCPVLEMSMVEASDLATVQLTPKEYATALSTTGVGEFLTRWKERVEAAQAILDQVEKRAWATLETGGTVPGWSIGRGRNGARKWVDPAAAETVLRERYGDRVFTLKLKTPPQIEEEFKPPKDLLKSMVTSTPTKKLVPVD